MTPKDIVRRTVHSLAKRFGYTVTVYRNDQIFTRTADFSQDYAKIIPASVPWTMTSPERLYVLINAVLYLSRNQIEGDIVECGVWKGGSMLAILKTLLQYGDTTRDLFLYDTFEGMTQPGAMDVDYVGSSGIEAFKAQQTGPDSSGFCYAPLDGVKQLLGGTGYPKERIHYVQGKVEETLPAQLPGKIALLRLDTDWYESTKHELEHLFPRLVPGGVLIIDDYGHWKGSKQAVDEYFSAGQAPILLNRIDYSGRVAVKLR